METRDYQTDPRSTQTLIALARESNPEPADGPYWEVARILGNRFQEDFESICELTRSTDARERALAATLLGQNFTKEKFVTAECARRLAEMLAHESKVDVIASIGIAFGHLADPQAVSALVPLRAHVDPRVRHAVVFGLLWQDVPAAIEAMIELSADADRETRNWATFGLGQIDVDTPELRDALARRLTDENDETRGEALAGLARRGAPSVMPGMIAELKRCAANGVLSTTLVADAMDSVAQHPSLANDPLWLVAHREFQSRMESYSTGIRSP